MCGRRTEADADRGKERQTERHTERHTGRDAQGDTERQKGKHRQTERGIKLQYHIVRTVHSLLSLVSQLLCNEAAINHLLSANSFPFQSLYVPVPNLRHNN